MLLLLVLVAGSLSLREIDDQIARHQAEIRAEIAAGRPVIVSIRAREGELAGAPYESTGGHLIVITGFDERGDVHVNDPATADPARGIVTYSNQAKQEMLGVSPETLAKFGAVSRETVLEMVAGVLAHSHAHWALAISGIAGPGGGSPEKPVGTVCFAWGGPGGWQLAREARFQGNRDAVREQAVATALQGVMDYLDRPE